jgi:hypothetical protein
VIKVSTDKTSETGQKPADGFLSAHFNVNVMKLLSVLLIAIAVSSDAGEDCIFSETAYMEFIHRYSADNRNSKIASDGRTLIINRNNEEIIVRGGGCIHLGVAIESRTEQAYTEEQFLQKTLDLSIEFGSWLINTEALKDSIAKGKYQKIDGTYYIDVDAMTVFSASYDNQGKINVDFYIN